MKTPHFCLKAGLRFILQVVLLTCGTKVPAQTTDTNLIPVITVQATQRIATESYPGVFTLFRTGNTNLTLNVWYDLGGTASNGVDYAAISNHLVEIPAGVTSNTVVITPLAGTSSSVAKTVVLTLTNSPMMTPVNYEIGSSSSAVVYIETNGATNLPPEVSIIQPTNGADFYTPTNILILAKASDPDGSVTNVEFFAGALDLGPGTPVVLDPPGVNGVTGLVYMYNWLNPPPPPGSFPLTAVATDNDGASTPSPPVNIVLQGPPKVDIYRPTNGAIFFAPVDIRISATASASNGIASVEFFADGQDLGPGILGGCTTPPVQICIYYLDWSNAPVGNHVLQAIAMDNDGLSSTSAPVNINVLQGPSTNPPPVVEISTPTNGETYYGRIICPPCITNNPPCELPCSFEGPDIPIFASAGASSGIASVEFFADGQDLGPGALKGCVMPLPLTCTYSLVWSNAPPGNHVLTAIAMDNDGLSSTSAPVNIAVIEAPETNLPPVVRIISPPDGAAFHAPINLPIYAFANDPDGFVASVQFFAGANSLGFGQRVPVITPLADGTLMMGGPVPPIYPTNLFFLIWTNAPVGTDALTAVATDNGGLSTTSAPVNIAILPPFPPTTNKPPVVSIVATDPVAIEGTNCWVWAGETNWPASWAAWPTAVCQYFTNCGPKTATFTVRRFGDTNSDLTVPYDINGTASNGVDYVALPGSATIPAGERRVLITIVPIDDGPPDVNKTVVLTLLPDMQMNPLPGYVLGFPRRAAAIIIDQGPGPTTGMLPGSGFHLAIPGPDAAWFSVQYSTDLVNWTPVCTNQVINGSIDFVDPDAPASPSRFYRAVPLTNAPSE